jgi:hypothetical protein
MILTGGLVVSCKLTTARVLCRQGFAEGNLRAKRKPPNVYELFVAHRNFKPDIEI